MNLIKVEEHSSNLLALIEQIKNVRQQRNRLEQQLEANDNEGRNLEQKLNEALAATKTQVSSYLGSRTGKRKIIPAAVATEIIKSFLADNVGHKFSSNKIAEATGVTPSMTKRILREESRKETPKIARSGVMAATRYTWNNEAGA